MDPLLDSTILCVMASQGESCAARARGIDDPDVLEKELWLLSEVYNPRGASVQRAVAATPLQLHCADDALIRGSAITDYTIMCDRFAHIAALIVSSGDLVSARVDIVSSVLRGLAKVATFEASFCSQVAAELPPSQLVAFEGARSYFDIVSLILSIEDFAAIPGKVVWTLADTFGQVAPMFISPPLATNTIHVSDDGLGRQATLLGSRLGRLLNHTPFLKAKGHVVRAIQALLPCARPPLRDALLASIHSCREWLDRADLPDDVERPLGIKYKVALEVAIDNTIAASGFREGGVPLASSWNSNDEGIATDGSL